MIKKITIITVVYNNKTTIEDAINSGRFEYDEEINYDEIREVENKITELFKK